MIILRFCRTEANYVQKQLKKNSFQQIFKSKTFILKNAPINDVTPFIKEYLLD